MSVDHWKRIEALYAAAAEMPPERQASFVAEVAAGDATVQREVESLLQEAAHVEKFMERSAIELEAARLFMQDAGALAGRMLGHYQLRELIGTGGMAEVYRAYDNKLGREVAVKAPHETAGGSSYRARLKREARLLAALNHPNIASVYGFEEDDSICALVLEMVEGETLSDRMKRRPLTTSEAIDIARQIAVALEAAHARGIVHRDLKPSNIKITPAGVVKVLDFGLAKMFDAPEATNQDWAFVTLGAPIQGTVSYMSPEQLRGDGIDQRSDIWAWGCVFYEMLAGERIFAADSLQRVLVKIETEDPDWSKIPGSTPSNVIALLKGCLQKDPTRRRQRIADVRIDLEGGNSLAPPRTAEIALSIGAARGLFLMIQAGYLSIYFALLYYLEGLGPSLDAAGLQWASPALPGVIVAAMAGIAIRLYLASAVALHHQDTGRNFHRLFPVLLLFDGAWAFSPLLAIRTIGVGIALGGSAALAYLPFSQRTLIRRMYPSASRDAR